MSPLKRRPPEDMRKADSSSRETVTRGGRRAALLGMTPLLDDPERDSSVAGRPQNDSTSLQGAACDVTAKKQTKGLRSPDTNRRDDLSYKTLCGSSGRRRSSRRTRSRREILRSRRRPQNDDTSLRRAECDATAKSRSLDSSAGRPRDDNGEMGAACGRPEKREDATWKAALRKRPKQDPPSKDEGGAAPWAISCWPVASPSPWAEEATAS